MFAKNPIKKNVMADKNIVFNIFLFSGEIDLAQHIMQNLKIEYCSKKHRTKSIFGIHIGTDYEYILF